MKIYNGIVTMTFPLVMTTVKRSTQLQHDSSPYSLTICIVFIKQVDNELLILHICLV